METNRIILRPWHDSDAETLFPGAFFAAMVYGLVFIWSRNIWYGIALHACHNLTA